MQLRQADFKILPLFQRGDLAPLCGAWSYSEWGCLENGNRTLDDVVQEYRRRAVAGSTLPRTWICMAGGKPAGMASLKRDDHEEVKDFTPWLASLFVHPAFRHHGIARDLCRIVIREAKAGGYKKLYLFTGGAQDFFRKMGWLAIGGVPDPCGLSMEGSVLMEYAIQPSEG